MHNHNKDSKFGLGLLVGVAAGVAGSYVLAKKKHEIKAKLWMLQAKYKIRERATQVRELTEDTFADIVDSVLREYEGVRGVTSSQIAELADKLKSRWQEFKAEARDRDMADAYEEET